ncbi:Retroviral-like aspartic protease 1 [Bienertia sinuspersici]
MVVNGEMNEVPTRLLVDMRASHNFLARREAKALGVKFTKVDGKVKSFNSRSMPVYGRAWDVSIRLGNWKGKIDFLVIDIDDEDVVLGMEFLAKVRPFTVSDGMLTITSKGSEVGIKLAQGVERDVRISSLKAWWTRRQEH